MYVILCRFRFRFRLLLLVDSQWGPVHEYIALKSRVDGLEQAMKKHKYV